MIPVSLSTLPLPPSTLSSLTKAGYETLQDIQEVSPEDLSEELGIPLPTSQALIFSHRNVFISLGSTLPMQPANLSRSETKARVSTLCAPLDRLLSGGVSRSSVLEISGAPGTPKEILAVKIVASFVKAGERVLFLGGCLVYSLPFFLLSHVQIEISDIPANFLELVSYMPMHTLSELMKFMYNLSSYLRVNADVALLVVNSISFPFQTSSTLTLQARTSLLNRIKETFSKACATNNLTIVATSQLATKLLKSDGTAGNFDTGARGIMVPQLGIARSSYLPPGRSYRVILSRKTRMSGTLRLLYSPTTVHQDNGHHVLEEPYAMVKNFQTDFM
ncbi:P-loop containing nucleoside triphosphate hydrolase protein [Desarmillaria tabescens]|uniref:P-loop containing nucleoside triphosphate hydrolase protein n=1 Tax=Armillaria tabescens TaxID=1929756 RepID=A0AA39N692_ARMTA|nr:P-loop containing nucleoside triphosphate hydrolase protein [Desarmillaria tabescens]KAK0458840.1 P-loop containing nucleoside triphosphate hydrolase protein [Desarmillaria tabescens]